MMSDTPDFSSTSQPPVEKSTMQTLNTETSAQDPINHLSIVGQGEFHVVNFIDKKRLGGTHTQEEIHHFVQEVIHGSVRNYQVAAWLMAATIQGLNFQETLWLTEAFIASGNTLSYPNKANDEVIIDKHSTGGIGDKISLLLMPLLACVLGIRVAKLSGHSLGRTGGTADKLAAVPNFNTLFTAREFVTQLQTHGIVLAQPSGDLTPAERIFYDLRDVTATVESIPLIAASIMAKKIATGADIILLDVKCGKGAFMKTLEEAKLLAQLCQELARHFNKKCVTVVSGMDAPIGYTVGLALEVDEVFTALEKHGEGLAPDLLELTLELGALVLVEAKKAVSTDLAKQMLLEMIHSGKAFQKLQAWFIAQGVDADEMHAGHSTGWLPSADRCIMLPSPKTGYVTELNPVLVADVMMLVGAAREAMEETLQYGAGILLHKQVGEFVEQGETLLELQCDAKSQKYALDILKKAIVIHETFEPSETLEAQYRTHRPTRLLCVI
ncbi:MAG: thymidine phosphorylase [Vampirovibrionales bacterium]